MLFLHTLQSTIERWRDDWEIFLWRSSPECREMVKERLILHQKAMKEGGTSPYFGDINPTGRDS